jgi:hypothetical protein
MHQPSLLNVHFHEKEIIDIRLLPKRSTEQVKRMKLLANERNFKRNSAVL